MAAFGKIAATSGSEVILDDIKTSQGDQAMRSMGNSSLVGYEALRHERSRHTATYSLKDKS
jgi:hypothetical protein